MTFMAEYNKIHSLYLRDNKGRFLGEFSRPEFEYLYDNTWLFTEKVDGTNIRIGYEPVTVDAAHHQRARFAGRTNNAQLPPRLLSALENLAKTAPFEDVFGTDDTLVTLYGEGYGAGIQKGGGKYRAEPGFVLFDVRVGDWLLERTNVEAVADKLGLDVVPLVFTGTLREAEARCKEGFSSRWGDFPAEGLVGTPVVPLWNRRGERVITKTKTKDYR